MTLFLSVTVNTAKEECTYSSKGGWSISHTVGGHHCLQLLNNIFAYSGGEWHSMPRASTNQVCDRDWLGVWSARECPFCLMYQIPHSIGCQLGHYHSHVPFQTQLWWYTNCLNWFSCNLGQNCYILSQVLSHTFMEIDLFSYIYNVNCADTLDSYVNYTNSMF